MSQNFASGDFLVFQLEAGFGLLRLLMVEDGVWHIAAYGDLFPDVNAAETAAENPAALTISLPHAALTNRAFESTQVARISNAPLSENEKTPVDVWLNDADHTTSDRSIRLMLGVR